MLVVEASTRVGQGVYEIQVFLSWVLRSGLSFGESSRVESKEIIGAIPDQRLFRRLWSERERSGRAKVKGKGKGKARGRGRDENGESEEERGNQSPNIGQIGPRKSRIMSDRELRKSPRIFGVTSLTTHRNY